MKSRTFTLEEAGKTLPLVQRIAEDIVRVYRDLSREAERYKALRAREPRTAEIQASLSTLKARMASLSEEIDACVTEAVRTFGGIDVVVNNASAINLAKTTDITMKAFDLMHQINVRGTFALSRACLRHLKESTNPHILTLCPPLNLAPGWLGNHLAYTLSKYGMSLCVLGLAEELRQYGIAANGLWPRTTIATSAVQNLLGGDQMVRKSRRPEMVADAAYEVLTRDSRTCTGNLFIDEDVLCEAGVRDLSRYAVIADEPLIKDFFVDEPRAVP